MFFLIKYFSSPILTIFIDYIINFVFPHVIAPIKITGAEFKKNKLKTKNNDNWKKINKDKLSINLL